MPVHSEFSSPESQVKVRVRSRRSNRGNQLFNNNNDASTANDNNEDDYNANNDSTSFAGLGEEELSSTTQDNIESNSEGYDAGLDDDADDSDDLGTDNESGNNSTATSTNNNNNNNNNDNESIGNSSDTTTNTNNNNSSSSNNNNNSSSNNNNSGNNNEDGTSALGRQHYLVATLMGVVCTHPSCNSKILARGSLWIASRQTIGRHFKDNQCWNVNSKPNQQKLEKDLKTSQILLHHRAKNNPTEALAMIDREFPSTCETFTAYYCKNCGASSKRGNNFNKHFGKKNTYGCTSATHLSRGTVIMNDFGLIVPQVILQQIGEGTFILPYKSPPINNNQSNLQQSASTSTTTTTTAPLQLPPPPSTPATQALPPSTFIASPEEMSKAISQCSPTAVNDIDNLHESLQCFIDQSKSEEEKKSTMSDAKRHTITLMALVDKYNPHTFGPKLREMSDKQDKPFDPSSDNSIVKLILIAGRRWLETGSANVDVSRCSANHRGMLYKIGSQASLPSEDALVQGSTFVPSGKMQYIVQEFEKLILFLSRSHWTGMKDQLTQAETILHAVPIGEFDEPDDNVKTAADNIVDTNILPGIILAALIESPHTPNGTNMIGMHLAARSIKAVAGRDHLGFKSGNVIAKIANSLLRLTRHAVCSFLVRKANGMTLRNQSSQDFTTYANHVLRSVQACYSVDITCRRIRSAREISNRQLAKVGKGFDPQTKQVMVENVYIDHSVWSNAILKTLADFDAHLRPLFNCTHRLFDVLNPNNKLVLLDSADSSVIVDSVGEERRVINICTDVIPALDTTAIQDVQHHINMCFRLTMGILLYFSSGAGRGIEVSRIGPFNQFCDNFQEYFNCLRFGMRSEKGINHGVDNNLPVAHYVPASLARHIVVCYLCLFPAAHESDFFTMPTMDKAPDEADAMFRTVMKLDNNDAYKKKRMNAKNNREFLIQIINAIAPKSLAKTSTTPENAIQFHHSPDVHNAIYPSTMYERDNNGRIIPSDLITARCYHWALGEPHHYTFNTIAAPVVDTIDDSLFDHAMQRVLKNPNASCYPDQKEICRLIADTTNSKSAFYKAAMGMGKSCAIYIPMIARKLAGVEVLRTIVVAPHNSLLEQMKHNIENCFSGTSLRIWTLSSRTLETQLRATTDYWDLLIVSIHSLKILLDTYRAELDSWNVKVIIIDECHLLFEENFRHNTSWSALQDLAALTMKMIFLSGTMNATTMKMIAHYTGIESDYAVVGSSQNYNVPNISINIRQVSHHRQLISDVTNAVINKIQRENAYITIITLSKEDAVNISNDVGNAGITSQWLTSDCTEAERRERMKDWPKGVIKSLASTFNCGTDSPFVSGVEHAGLPRGVAAALQAAGRVRPNNQQGINTEVNFWIDPSNVWNNTDEQWNSAIAYMKEAGLFRCFNSVEEVAEATVVLKSLFHPSGFQSIVNGNQCLRRAMLEQIDVVSTNCNMCTQCRRNNPYLQQAAEARQRVRTRVENKQYVLNNMMALLRQCFVCGEAYCYGTRCLMPNHTRCVKCHGPARQYNAHDPRECKAKHIPLYGTAFCVLCFLPRAVKVDEDFTSDFPKNKCGKMPNAVPCPLGDRVRRILLYDLSAVDDDGTQALNRLGSVCIDAELWYERMAINMRMINTNRS